MIYTNITKGRYVNIRPVLNQSHPVQVYVSLCLAYIQEFHEVKGKLGLTALVYVHGEMKRVMESFGKQHIFTDLYG